MPYVIIQVRLIVHEPSFLIFSCHDSLARIVEVAIGFSAPQRVKETSVSGTEIGGALTYATCRSNA
jgi:cephalosporin-C deacetylase-like acetyl esterase